MEPNLVLITIASIMGAVGLALLFVGSLMAMLVALGNKHYLAGISIFVFFPTAFFYGLWHRKNMAYALSLLAIGMLLFLLFLILLWWELDRLGIDFFEIISSTRPKH